VIHRLSVIDHRLDTDPGKPSFERQELNLGLERRHLGADLLPFCARVVGLQRERIEARKHLAAGDLLPGLDADVGEAPGIAGVTTVVCAATMVPVIRTAPGARADLIGVVSSKCRGAAAAGEAAARGPARSTSGARGNRTPVGG
jgi:hypothetical protein